MARSNQIGFFQEARTKVFLLYVALMLASVALAVPIFRARLFRAVDARVNEQLLEEAAEFDDVYHQWLASDNASFETLLIAMLLGSCQRTITFLLRC